MVLPRLKLRLVHGVVAALLVAAGQTPTLRTSGNLNTFHSGCKVLQPIPRPAGRNIPMDSSPLERGRRLDHVHSVMIGPGSEDTGKVYNEGSILYATLDNEVQ